jgi:hypothetical protein
MKISIILILLLIIACFSCESIKKVGFSHPLPPRGKQNKIISKKIIGHYKFSDNHLILLSLYDTLKLNDADGVRTIVNNEIEITKDSINTIIKGELRINKDSVDKKFYEFVMSKMDSFIISHYPFKYNKRIDSIDNITTIKLDVSKNLFLMSDSTFLKKYKWKYYFNTYFRGWDRWYCFQVIYKQKNRQLNINTFTDEDYAVINRIMKLNGDDNTENNYYPSSKTFRKFLKLNGFERKIILIRK